MKAMAAGLLLLVMAMGIVAGVLRQQFMDMKDLQRQINGLYAKLAEHSKADHLNLQAQCAEQARKAFADEGYKKGISTNYENHYNVALGTCFINVQNGESTAGSFVTGRTLFDAFEGKVYGSYVWSTEKDKKYWEVPPIECFVMVRSGSKQTCHSADEFDELAKTYMEGN